MHGYFNPTMIGYFYATLGGRFRPTLTVESVIEILEPQAVVITSNEIYEYYRDYGSVNAKNQRAAGKLIDDDRMIWVDHPGSPWWNRAKNDEQTSKMKFEDSLRKIYCE